MSDRLAAGVVLVAVLACRGSALAARRAARDLAAGEDGVPGEASPVQLIGEAVAPGLARGVLDEGVQAPAVDVTCRLPSGRLMMPSLPTLVAAVGLPESTVSGFQNEPEVQCTLPSASTSEAYNALRLESTSTLPTRPSTRPRRSCRD
jgi:hypothetical protein